MVDVHLSILFNYDEKYHPATCLIWKKYFGVGGTGAIFERKFLPSVQAINEISVEPVFVSVSLFRIQTLNQCGYELYFEETGTYILTLSKSNLSTKVQGHWIKVNVK